MEQTIDGVVTLC